jgi:hypothetical protein
MKLHTDFHDYYDNAVGYGIDEKVHYNRFTKEVEMRVPVKQNHPTFFRHAIYLLGFCGQIYPIVEVQTENDDREVIRRRFAYNFDELVEFEKEKHEYNKLNRQNSWYRFSPSYYGFSNHEKHKITQIFTDWKWQDDKLFLEHKVPIWVKKLDQYNQTAIINPKLKDYGFDRISDSFVTFQEISMYLSNILVEQKDVVKIEDKYRIEQHGFDLKTSFRKEKKSQD